MNKYIVWGLIVSVICILVAIIIAWWIGLDDYGARLDQYEQDLADIVVPTKKEILDSLLPEDVVDTYTERQEQIQILESIKSDEVDIVQQQAEVPVQQGTPTRPPVIPPEVLEEEQRRIDVLDGLL